MTVVAVASGGKAAGASSTALGLSMLWANQSPLLVELDPTGGDFRYQWGVDSRATIFSLASRASSGGDPASLLDEHSITVPGSTVRAVVAPGESKHLDRVMIDLTSKYALLFAERLTVADFGRLGTAPSRLSAADVLVMLVRPDVADVSRCRQQLADLRTNCPVVVASMGANPYGAEEIAETLGVETCVQIAWDPAPVRTAWNGVDIAGKGSWSLRRSAWWRSIRSLGDQIALHTPLDLASELVNHDSA